MPASLQHGLHTWAISGRGELSVKSSGCRVGSERPLHRRSDAESEALMVAAICILGRAAAPSLSEAARNPLVDEGGGYGHRAEQSGSSQDNA